MKVYTMCTLSQAASSSKLSIANLVTSVPGPGHGESSG
jgi:hypothetical protein